MLGGGHCSPHALSWFWATCQLRLDLGLTSWLGPTSHRNDPTAVAALLGTAALALILFGGLLWGGGLNHELRIVLATCQTAPTSHRNDPIAVAVQSGFTSIACASSSCFGGPGLGRSRPRISLNRALNRSVP